MASIVWRWNHPENGKRQIDRKGWPNQKLYNDLLMFYFNIEKAQSIADSEDQFLEKRLKGLIENDKRDEAYRKALLERKNKIVETVEEIRHTPVFTEACEFYGVKPFVPENGKDSWEERFLLDIKNRMIKGQVLSDKQAKKLWEILDSDSKEVLPATERQKNYLIRLGYEGDIDSISKADASTQISKIKKEKWG